MIPPLVTTLTLEKQLEIAKMKNNLRFAKLDPQVQEIIINLFSENLLLKTNISQLVKHIAKGDLGL